MKWVTLVWILAAPAVAAAAAPRAVRLTRFAVIHLDAPPAEAFPLFGPLGEKKWAGRHWSPEFVYPPGGKDVEGCVFTTGRRRETTWILTTFDPAGLRARYVHVTAGERVVQLDIALSPEGAGRTAARITCSWTGLSEEGNRMVERHGRTFDESMSEWESVINAYLAGARK